jgi:hypothetical protein
VQEPGWLNRQFQTIVDDKHAKRISAELIEALKRLAGKLYND